MPKSKYKVPAYAKKAAKMRAKVKAPRPKAKKAKK